MALAERNHGTGIPADGVDDVTRGNHVLQGFANVAHEGVRAALSVDVGDIGRAVLQTGGAVPGLYEARALGTGLDKWTQVGGSVTAQPITLIVRTGVGSDAADGLTSGTSLATLAEAVARVPFHIAKGHPVKIRLGDGTYPRPVWGTRIVADDLVIVGDGGGVGNGFTVVKAVQTAATGTNASQIVDPVGGLGINAHRGQTILAIAGPGAGQRAFIAENTAAGYIFARDVATAFTDATTFEVVEAAVELSYAGAFLSLDEIEGLGQAFTQDTAQGTAPCYVVAQVKRTTPDSVFVNFTNVTLVEYGVELGGAGQYTAELSHATHFMGIDDFGGFAADIPNNLGLAANNTEWRGWSVGEVDAGTGPANYIYDFCVVLGYPVLPFFGFISPCRAFLFGGQLFGDTVTNNPSIFARDLGFVSVFPTGTPGMKIVAVGSRDAVNTRSAGRISLKDANLTSATGALIRGLHGGVTTVLDGCSGVSSGGLAVDAKEGGRVYLPTGTVPTFSGSPALDYDPGGGAAVAAAFFATDGDYTSNADGSVIQRAS